MTDVLIFEGGNGGDISLKNGDIEMTDGIYNQAYLAHFGGNVGYSTTGQEVENEERFDWFGNQFLNEEAQMNSLLENSLLQNSLTSSGRLNIENDAKKDLEYLSEIAELSSKVNLTGKDRIDVKETINQSIFNYLWEGTKGELIENRII